MDSIVARLAVAGCPEPMPFVVQLLAHQRRLGRRTTPEIIVHRGRQRRRRADLADAVTRPVNQRVSIANGAELATSQVVKRLAQERARTILHAHLDHAPISPGRRHHLTALPQVIGKRLLDINVFAGLARPDRRQRVPVVGRRDDHRVDALVVQNSAEVSVSSDRFAPVLEGLEFAVQERPVHVAQSNDGCARDLSQPGNELVSAPAHTSDGLGCSHSHHGQADRIAGSCSFGLIVAAGQDSRQPKSQPGYH